MLIKIVMTMIIVLLMIGIIMVDKLFICNKNNKQSFISSSTSFCLIISLLLVLVLLWLKALISALDIQEVSNNTIIACGISLIAFFMTIPLIGCIIAQMSSFKRHSSNQKCLTDVIIGVDLLVIFLILFLYLYVNINDLTNSDAHGLFPSVLGCAVCSLIPFGISIYMYICNNVNFPILDLDKKEKLINVCTSAAFEGLSMLGISLTFDSILYSADKYLSVGFVYWGTYFFMILSLLIIAINTMYKKLD